MMMIADDGLGIAGICHPDRFFRGSVAPGPSISNRRGRAERCREGGIRRYPRVPAASGTHASLPPPGLHAGPRPLNSIRPPTHGVTLLLSKESVALTGFTGEIAQAGFGVELAWPHTAYALGSRVTPTGSCGAKLFPHPQIGTPASPPRHPLYGHALVATPGRTRTLPWTRPDTAHGSECWRVPRRAWRFRRALSCLTASEFPEDRGRG